MSNGINEYEKIIDTIKKQIPNVYIWIEKSTGIYDKENNTFVLEVPDNLHQKTLNEKYKDDIDRIIKESINKDVALKIIIRKDPEDKNVVLFRSRSCNA